MAAEPARRPGRRPLMDVTSAATNAAPFPTMAAEQSAVGCGVPSTPAKKRRIAKFKAEVCGRADVAHRCHPLTACPPARLPGPRP